MSRSSLARRARLVVAATALAALSACGLVAGLDGLQFVPACARDADCDDGDPCTLDTCDARADACGHAPAAAGLACGDGGRVCDGAGACVECLADADCPGPSDDCRRPICGPGHACGVAFTDAGAPVAAQVPRDCHTVRCDGLGGTTDEVDDADLPDDGNDCTDDACVAGGKAFTHRAAGTLCGAAHDLLCDGAGHCTGCTKDGQCTAPDTCGGAGMPGVCGCAPLACDPQRTCGTIADAGCGVGPIACGDLTQDGDETDVDCGGPGCPQCPDGSKCGADGDCQNGHCVDGVCCAAACTELCKVCPAAGVNKGKCVFVNAGNADPDTGCAGPSACDGFGNCILAAGQPCQTLGQCSTHHCVDSVCCNTACNGTCQTCATGKCLDVVKNQPDPDTCDPTTLACNGASLCLPKLGEPCLVDGDCASGHCADGVCCNVDCSVAAPCKACNLPNKVGTCSNHNGIPCGAGGTCSAGMCQ